MATTRREDGVAVVVDVRARRQPLPAVGSSVSSPMEKLGTKVQSARRRRVAQSYDGARIKCSSDVLIAEASVPAAVQINGPPSSLDHASCSASAELRHASVPRGDEPRGLWYRTCLRRGADRRSLPMTVGSGNSHERDR